MLQENDIKQDGIVLCHLSFLKCDVSKKWYFATECKWNHLHRVSFRYDVIRVNIELWDDRLVLLHYSRKFGLRDWWWSQTKDEHDKSHIYITQFTVLSIKTLSTWRNLWSCKNLLQQKIIWHSIRSSILTWQIFKTT